MKDKDKRRRRQARNIRGHFGCERVDLGASPGGRPPGSHAPTTMATVPPGQGGIQILGTIVDDHPVLLTEALLSPKTDRERMDHV